VTGTVTSPTNGWTSEITSDRFTWSTNNPATYYAGDYTMVIPAFDDNTNGPAGYGSATVNVSTNGKVKFTSGVLADTQLIKQASYISGTGVWPVYAPLYFRLRAVSSGATLKENHGELIGWLTIQTNLVGSNLAPLGELDWINPGGTNTFWTAGHTNQFQPLASRWLGVAPLLNWTTNGVADVSGGELGTNGFSANLTLTTNKLFSTVPLTNKFTTALVIKNGAIKGAFTNAAAATVKWTGVLLQDYNYGRGFFTSTNGAGKVEVHQAP
jgi:hypothetical protein